MSFKNFALFILFLLNINFETSPKLFPFIDNGNYETQFKAFLAEREHDKLITTACWTAGFIPYIAALYACDVLYKEASKVIVKYPFAQQWYDAMILKYPQAHFDQKQFLQTTFSQYPSYCNIYFSHDSLRQINTIYKKKLENQSITDDEQLVLQQKEFLLLYQAGYIEKSCAMYAGITGLSFYAARSSLIVPALKLLHSPSKIKNFDDMLQEADKFDSNHSLISTIDLALYFVAYGSCINQIFDTFAYTFACTNADDNCLHAAIEDEANNSHLTAIHNEITRRQN